MSTRSRSRGGAKPRITRYARNGADQFRVLNPLTQLPVYAGVWADDPAWVNGGVGTAPASLLLGGSLLTSGAYLDPTLGLVLPGVAGNYASVPDSAALDITGDITLVALVALDDWTPASDATVLGKWTTTGSQQSFALFVTMAGVLRVNWSTTGGDNLSAVSTVTPTIGNGETLWVAVSFDVDDGGGNRVIKFWTSSDGSTWTQLGSTVTTVGATSIYASTALLEFGTINGGTSNRLDGTLSVARIYSGSGFSAAGPSGTLVLDVDFRRSRTNSFTCDTGQTVTVASTFDPTQGTAAARGTLTTSALLGGRRVIDLDGADDCYPLTTGVSLAQPFEVWAVAVTDSIKAQALLGVQSGATARMVGTVATGDDWYANLGGSNLTGGTYAAATAYAARYICNGASTQIIANGVSQASGVAAGTMAMDQFVIGAGRTAPSTYQFFWDGKIACLLTLPAASITQAHRTAMGQWAAQFYGVPGFAGAFG